MMLWNDSISKFMLYLGEKVSCLPLALDAFAVEE